jgi:uncharacterized protein (TIGR02145 family)
MQLIKYRTMKTNPNFMKNLLILFAIFSSLFATAQSVAISSNGSTANASSMLDVNSTTKGFLPPRMTSVQKTAIVTPAAGLQVWCSDCGTYGEMQVFNGYSWTNMNGGAAATIPSVTIGTQNWMLRNLDVATYSDGTPIPQVTDPTAWAGLTTGAWCYYNNDATIGATYGKLYNWYAVAGIHDTDANTPNKSLAPSGWHVSTFADWATLSSFAVGGLNDGMSAGGKAIKEAGTAHWPVANGTNTTGFTGLPAGRLEGGFGWLNASATWWTTTENDPTAAWFYGLMDNDDAMYRGTTGKEWGYSVRLLRD